MTKEKLSSSRNVVSFPTTTLMHASLDTKDVMFNKPFESVKDVQDFIIWLVKSRTMCLKRSFCIISRSYNFMFWCTSSI